MFGLGIWELGIVAFMVVLLFGSKKLPALGSSFGKAIRNFKDGIGENEMEVESDFIEHSKAEL